MNPPTLSECYIPYSIYVDIRTDLTAQISIKKNTNTIMASAIYLVIQMILNTILPITMYLIAASYKPLLYPPRILKSSLAAVFPLSVRVDP